MTLPPLRSLSLPQQRRVTAPGGARDTSMLMKYPDKGKYRVSTAQEAAATMTKHLYRPCGTSGVDAVSGATYSSHAIFNAVNDALSKAKKNSSSTEKKEETTTEKKEETTTEKKEETTTEKKEETTTEKKEETTTEKKEETTENPDEGKNRHST